LVVLAQKWVYNQASGKVERQYDKTLSPKEKIESDQLAKYALPQQGTQFEQPTVTQAREMTQAQQMPSSGDPFMDKIKGILAQGAPAITNTQAFQEQMPTAYAGNQNMQDLQRQYEQQYQNYLVQNAKPGYTDPQIEKYLQAEQAVPPITSMASPIIPSPKPTTQTSEEQTMPYANPIYAPKEFVGQERTVEGDNRPNYRNEDMTSPQNWGFTNSDGGINYGFNPTEEERSRGLVGAELIGMAVAPGIVGGIGSVAQLGKAMIPYASHVTQGVAKSAPIRSGFVNDVVREVVSNGRNISDIGKYGLSGEEMKLAVQLMKQLGNSGPVSAGQAMVPFGL